jgi:hypothetical protein
VLLGLVSMRAMGLRSCLLIVDGERSDSQLNAALK